MEDFIELQLDPDLQRDATEAIIDLGADFDNLHPVAFAIAMVEALQVVCEQEGLNVYDILHHVTTDFDEELH